MAVRGLALLVGILLIGGCGLATPIPNMQFRVAGKAYAAARGSYCWQSWGHGECVDTTAPVAPAPGGTVTAAPSATVTLLFDRDPDGADLQVGPTTNLLAAQHLTRPFRFTLPTTAGTYLHEVAAHYPEGVVNFDFWVAVR